VINKAPKNSAVWGAAGNDERKRENSSSHSASAPAFALFGEVKLRYECVNCRCLTLHGTDCTISMMVDDEDQWLGSFQRRTNIASSNSSELHNNLYQRLVCSVKWLFVLATTQTKVMVVEASEFFKNYETKTTVNASNNDINEWWHLNPHPMASHLACRESATPFSISRILI
jgi:hypothetical protein